MHKIRVYYSYAKADEAARKTLNKHLHTLLRQGKIDLWYPSLIIPGGDLSSEAHARLLEADLVLLLLSADLLDDAEQLAGREALKGVLERRGEVRVVPIRVRPVHLAKGEELAELAMLPAGDKAISELPLEAQERAWTEIARKIDAVVDELQERLRAQAPLGGLTNIGPYRIDFAVAEGGTAQVLKATHQVSQWSAAIKLLSPERSHDQRYVERLFREAATVNRINHPGVLKTPELGRLQDQTPYLVMEYVDGETLQGRLHDAEPLPLPLALRFARQIADAMSAVHRQKVWHRDLKPSNIMIVADPEVVGGERIKILDFGLAKTAAAGSGPATQDGVVLGTPAYMSPEQLRGAGQVDEKTDVYALGVILYQMVTDQLPSPAEDNAGLRAQHLTQAPPRPQSALPGPLERLLQRMMDKHPAARPTMTEVVAEIRWLESDLTQPPLVAPAPASTIEPQRRRDLEYLIMVLVSGLTGLGGGLLLAGLIQWGEVHPTPARDGSAVGDLTTARDLTTAMTPTELAPVPSPDLAARDLPAPKEKEKKAKSSVKTRDRDIP